MIRALRLMLTAIFKRWLLGNTWAGLILDKF